MIYWYEKAVELKHSELVFYLRVYYSQNKGIDKMVQWYEIGAKYNDRESMHNLAWHYNNNNKFDEANLKLNISMHSLANIYRVRNDCDNMMEWYIQAVKHSHVISMFELGCLYKDMSDNYNMVQNYEMVVRYGNYNALIELCKYYIDTKTIKK